MKQTKEPEFFSKQITQARRFYIEGATQKSGRLKIVCGGCEQTHPNFRIDRRDFPYYSIEFVAKGQGTVVLAGQSFILKPGTVFSYGPHTSQVITNDAKNAMTKYFVDFVGSTAKQMLKKYITSCETATSVSRPDEIARIFDVLIRHGISDSPYKSKICSTLLEYLFYRIAEVKIAGEAELTRAFVIYQICRQYVRDNFVNITSLQDIADHCRLDRAYLCRLFKRFDTQSPYHYLMYLKMASAAQRLQEPGTLVKEIAFDLGFDDPFHFSRMFKNIFGVSPRSFKNLRSDLVLKYQP
jgi:AraC-like DNA-binding protein/REP element-mobilizing transposase RayT